MNEATESTKTMIDGWADDPKGPVALRLKQKLLSAGEDAIVYPPTYADIGYNIDVLQNGTRTALIDSVGSQANRMEPIFKREPYSNLVPQIEIKLEKGEKKDTEEKAKTSEKRSLLDLAHRSADAIVQACPNLSKKMAKAFASLKHGDAGPLCQLAPTSLVFGVWDSRGESNEKRPRLVRSVIRAWDVEVLNAAAQFNSVWKALTDSDRTALKAEAKKQKVKLSNVGFADAPATFRKVSDGYGRNVRETKDGQPNPDRRVLGGVLVNGRIERDVVVNLIALRSLRGTTANETKEVRRYVLALTLIAATADMDLFLREGCLLRYAGDDQWTEVPRRGEPKQIELASDEVQRALLAYAHEAAASFRRHWPKGEELTHEFDLAAAKKLLKKPVEGDETQ